MENNFYVGSVFHRRKFRFPYIEQVVLYSDDDYYYLDLLNEKWYSTCTSNKDYVIKGTVIPTDISDYKIDYNYLLEKNRYNKPKVKIKTKSTN